MRLIRPKSHGSADPASKLPDTLESSGLLDLARRTRKLSALIPAEGVKSPRSKSSVSACGNPEW